MDLRRPRAQHPRRPAHRLAGRHLDRAGPGFGGLRDADGDLQLRPRLPRGSHQARVHPLHPGPASAGRDHHTQATYALGGRRPAADPAPRPAVTRQRGNRKPGPSRPYVPAPAQPAVRTRASPPRAGREPELATARQGRSSLAVKEARRMMVPPVLGGGCEGRSNAFSRTDRDRLSPVHLRLRICALVCTRVDRAEVAAVRKPSRSTEAPTSARPASAQISRHSSARAIPRSPKYCTPRSADSAAPCGSTGFRPE